MKKTMIIIGAGIAGLSTGCYGQMNGYSTEIFELHNLPGGLCTSWKRKGYTFDGCIHWLVGSNKNSSMYKMWEELGAVQGQKFVNHDEFTRIIAKNGKTFILYTNVDQLEKHMKELAPEDTLLIREWCNVIRDLSKVDLPLDIEEYSLGEKIKTIKELWPLIKNFRKYSKTSVKSFAERFKNPFMREVIPQIFGLEEFSLIPLLFTLAWMNAENAAFPIGGSLAFAHKIEKKYLELGGTIHYNSPVKKIIVKEHKAIGIGLEDGREFFADYIISAADGHKTIFEMLEGKYIDNKILGYYRDLLIFKPEIQVSIGVNRDLSNEPHSVKIPLNSPIEIGGEIYRNIGIKHYCFDNSLAPQGKSTVVALLTSNYDYWSKLYKTPEKYTAEKKRISSIVIESLEELYPGISVQVEVIDVATPMTYERYTGNWQGSMEGWLPSTKGFGLRMRKDLPGLKNFFMAGQWVEPGGGIPTAALSGRNLMKKLCKKDHTQFIKKG